MSDPDSNSIKVGDIVSMEMDVIVKRRWWQFWKERYYPSGERVLRKYVVTDQFTKDGKVMGCLAERS